MHPTVGQSGILVLLKVLAAVLLASCWATADSCSSPSRSSSSQSPALGGVKEQPLTDSAKGWPADFDCQAAPVKHSRVITADDLLPRLHWWAEVGATDFNLRTARVFKSTL